MTWMGRLAADERFQRTTAFEKNEIGHEGPRLGRFPRCGCGHEASGGIH